MSERGRLPRRPFRDSALIYGALAGIVVLFGWLSGSPILPDPGERQPGAVGIAAFFFLIATGYSWWRFRERLRRSEEAAKR